MVLVVERNYLDDRWYFSICLVKMYSYIFYCYIFLVGWMGCWSYWFFGYEFLIKVVENWKVEFEI